MPTKEKLLFLRELEVMTRVRHPNIVQFLGYVDLPFVIIMELCPHGDLRTYWTKHKLGTAKKLRICIEVLRALAYMHNRKHVYGARSGDCAVGDLLSGVAVCLCALRAGPPPSYTETSSRRTCSSPTAGSPRSP